MRIRTRLLNFVYYYIMKINSNFIKLPCFDMVACPFHPKTFFSKGQLPPPPTVPVVSASLYGRYGRRTNQII